MDRFDTGRLEQIKPKALQHWEHCAAIPVVKFREHYFSDVCYASLSAYYITNRKNKKFDSLGALLHRNQCCARFFPVTSVQTLILCQCWTFLIVVSLCCKVDLPLEVWLEGTGMGGLCVSGTAWGSCSPCSSSTHPHLPRQWGGAPGLYLATQAGLVHIAVKVHVWTLFTLGLMWGVA